MSDYSRLISSRVAEAPALRRPENRIDINARLATPAGADSAPELPPDLLRRIVLDSLHLHGSDLAEWLRLSLVCKDWRSFLLGELALILTLHAVPRSLATCVTALCRSART